MISKPFALAALALAVALPAAASTTVFTKPPNEGPFWAPLGPAGGSYVYADSFLAPAGETRPTRLGTWLLEYLDPAPSVRFEIWGTTGGGAPDAASVLASTASLLVGAGASLGYFEAPVTGTSSALTPGERYWFVATVVGESGTGKFQVGAHTQNSVYADNGTFAYSNDPAGVAFVAIDRTPEMAFRIEFGPDILIYDNPCSTPSYFLSVLEDLGRPHTAVVDSDALAAQLTGGTDWDLVVVDSYGSGLSFAAESALIDYVDAGGHLAIAYWAMHESPALAAALDAAADPSSFISPIPIHAWLPAEPIFVTPNALPNPLTPNGDGCFEDGSAYDALPFGRALGGYSVAPSSTTTALVLGNAGRTVLLGEVPGNFGGDDNENQQADGYDLAENVVDYLLSAIFVDGHDSGGNCAWTGATGWSQGCANWCGDGNLDFGEECDDGNLDPGDGCDETCAWSCVGFCGQGLGGDVCWCDANCVINNDCCYDACTVCGQCS